MAAFAPLRYGQLSMAPSAPLRNAQLFTINYSLFPHHHKRTPEIGIWKLSLEIFLGFEEGSTFAAP
jgi:hypothetical protein